MSDLRPNRRVSIPALALVFAAALAGCGGEELVGTLEKASGSLVKATTTKSTASLAPAAPPVVAPPVLAPAVPPVLAPAAPPLPPEVPPVPPAVAPPELLPAEPFSVSSQLNRWLPSRTQL